MSYSKRQYEEYWEDQWVKEQMYLQYERDLGYYGLKGSVEFAPFIVNKKVYTSKMANFVKNINYGTTGRSKNRTHRNIKKGQF